MIMATTIPPDELAAQHMVMVLSYLAIGLAVAGAVIAGILRVRRGTTKNV